MLVAAPLVLLGCLPDPDSPIFTFGTNAVQSMARAREALTTRAAALATAQGTARANRMRMFQSALPEETRLQTLRLKHAREQLGC